MRVFRRSINQRPLRRQHPSTLPRRPSSLRARLLHLLLHRHALLLLRLPPDPPTSHLGIARAIPPTIHRSLRRTPVLPQLGIEMRQRPSDVVAF